MRHALGATAIALAVVLVPPARGQEDEPEPPRIYECTGADGATVYQDDPCPELPPAPPAKAAPVKKATQIAKIVTPPPKLKSTAATSPPPKFTGKLPSDEEWARIAAINRPGAGAMGTPERVWEAFVTALRAGDRAAAARYVGAANVSTLESWTPQELQSRGNSYSGLVIKNNVGPQRVAGATRRNGRVTWVFFERAGGEWRIVSM